MAFSTQSAKKYQLRSGLFILPEHDQKFNRLLSDLLRDLPAKFIMLVDITGQVILAKGEHKDTNLVMLGSLIAGDLAASREIARLTGEYQDYQIILREGQHSHSFIVEAGNYLILLIQVDNEVLLGWARMLIIKTAQQLANVVTQTTLSAAEVADMEHEIALSLDKSEESLVDLFGDALDEMWGE
ncbi:MAG TPA: hypothetical protein EYP90_08120 [Chromatiaceae bacterium]|nr:hypothetical protein [Chromatiaceae bacterium]HIP72383.1 hypothetical protein [Anaerolineae bacterium]